MCLSGMHCDTDLRWNGAGVSGGRALLAALQANSTLQHLHTEGNSIPPEITDAISKSHRLVYSGL